MKLASVLVFVTLIEGCLMAQMTKNQRMWMNIVPNGLFVCASVCCRREWEE